MTLEKCLAEVRRRGCTREQGRARTKQRAAHLSRVSGVRGSAGARARVRRWSPSFSLSLVAHSSSVLPLPCGDVRYCRCARRFLPLLRCCCWLRLTSNSELTSHLLYWKTKMRYALQRRVSSVVKMPQPLQPRRDKAEEQAARIAGQVPEEWGRTERSAAGGPEAQREGQRGILRQAAGGHSRAARSNDANDEQRPIADHPSSFTPQMCGSMRASKPLPMRRDHAVWLCAEAFFSHLTT